MGGRTKRELEDENAELRDALDDVYERIGDASAVRRACGPTVTRHPSRGIDSRQREPHGSTSASHRRAPRWIAVQHVERQRRHRSITPGCWCG